MATPHNSAQKGEIAKTVLLPGDPLRAKYIAEQYLTEVHPFNRVRNMLGFTGSYKGTQVSVMGSGMGMPSIGIYSYELFQEYDVDNIIRIGSAGALADTVQLKDLVIAMGACTDSNYAAQYGLNGTFAPIADFGLLQDAVAAAKRLGLHTSVGNVLSSDVFYRDDETVNDGWKKMHVLAVEMEAAALYMNAARLGKHALCVVTISDHLYRKESLPAEERQTGLNEMIEMALETACRTGQLSDERAAAERN